MKFQEIMALSAAKVHESIKDLDLTLSQNRAIERKISDLLSSGKSQDIDVDVHHVQDEGDCYKAFYTFEDPETGKDRHGSIYFKARILDYSVEDFEEKTVNEGLDEAQSFKEEPIPPFAVCYTYDGVVHKDDVYMGSRAECLEYMRTHKVKKPFTFDLMDTDSGRLVSFSLRENKAKKTPRPTFKFTACSYEQFERLCTDSESYDETEIDGKSVIAAYDGKNCIGMWYRRAKVGSFCREFVGDELSYSEADPNWPYGN